MSYRRCGIGSVVAVVAAGMVQIFSAPAANAAAILSVPADHPSIQAAIDAAAPDDVVLVSPGTYHERIDFQGKAIEVRSATDAPWGTVLDGDGAGSVVTFDGGEGRASVLRGFQIREGLGPSVVGSASCSSPTITNNHITENQAVTGGGGIGVRGGSPLIVDNRIQANGPSPTTADGAGGGIAVDGGSPEIVDNWLFDNKWLAGGGVALSGTGTQFRNNRIVSNEATATYGGGVLLVGNTDATIVQNVVIRNTATLAGGGIGSIALGTKEPVIVHNSIGANQAPKGSGVYAGPQETLVLVNNVVAGPFASSAVECESASFAELSHNSLYNGSPSPASGCGAVVGANGNIGTDPQFYSESNFHLTGRSGAIDGGDPAAPFVPPVDFDGNARVVDGDGNGTATTDMGAFETGAPNLGPPEGWGWNIVGAVGDGTTTDRHAPVPVNGLTNVVAVAGGVYHSIALRRDGTVWSWGWNGAGQLGDGTTTDRSSPVPVTGLTDVSSVAAGYYHNIAVQNGSIYLWGWNVVGQLGTGDYLDRHVPVPSMRISGMVRVAAGAYHTLALEGDGTINAWGWNGVGQLGDGTTADRNLPVFLGIGHVVEIAAGAFHSMLLKDDGTTQAWGWNGAGQLGDGTTVDRHVPTVIPGAAGAMTIGAGAYHSLAS